MFRMPRIVINLKIGKDVAFLQLFTVNYDNDSFLIMVNSHFNLILRFSKIWEVYDLLVFHTSVHDIFE